jgi:uncharacterized protein
MRRRDYAFPFRIDGGSRQAAEAAYAEHVKQMIRQILLTAPGERVNLPEFGCGLRQLIFAPHDEALDATTQMIVQESLTRWLSQHIEVKRVAVATPEETPDRAQLLVTIEYVLLETRSTQQTAVRIGVGA